MTTSSDPTKTKADGTTRRKPGRPPKKPPNGRETATQMRVRRMLTLATAVVAPTRVRGRAQALVRHVVFKDEVESHPVTVPVATKWHKAERPETSRRAGGPHTYRVYVSDYQQPSNPVTCPTERRKMTAKQLRSAILGRRISRDVYVDLEDVVGAIYRACPIPTPLSSKAKWNPYAARALRTAYQRPEFQAYGHCTPLLVHLTTLAPAGLRNPGRSSNAVHRVVRWELATLPNPKYTSTARPTIHAYGWAASMDIVIAALRHMVSPAAKYTAWQPIVYCVRRNSPYKWPDQVKARVLPQFLRDAITAVADELQRIRNKYPAKTSLPANLVRPESTVPPRNREDSRRLAHKAPEKNITQLMRTMSDPLADNPPAEDDEDDEYAHMDAAARAEVVRQAEALAAMLEGTDPPDLSTEAQPEWV